MGMAPEYDDVVSYFGKMQGAYVRYLIVRDLCELWESRGVANANVHYITEAVSNSTTRQMPTVEQYGCSRCY